MYAAMRDARRAIATTPNGVRTWGAYQHYGNPYLRFFDPTTMYLDQARSQENEMPEPDPPVLQDTEQHGGGK